jgi:hypothetical protein
MLENPVKVPEKRATSSSANQRVIQGTSFEIFLSLAEPSQRKISRQKAPG